MNFLNLVDIPPEFRIPLEDIIAATGNFANQNILKHRGGDEHAYVVYKGELFSRLDKEWTHVVIRRSNRHHHLLPVSTRPDVDLHFRNEVLAIYRVEEYYQDTVSFIGFCDEKDERIIVMEHLANGNLDQHLHDPTLTWRQRLDICSVAANVLLEVDDIYVIRGFKIMLDEDRKARLLFCFKPISDRADTVARNSVVYDLGVVMLKVLYGRKVTMEDIDEYLAKYDDVNYIQMQSWTEPFFKFSDASFRNAAKLCLQGQPYDSSYVREIIDAVAELKITVEIHDTSVQGYLKIPLEVIQLATDNFHKNYFIGSGGYGSVYKAKLENFSTRSYLAKKLGSKEKISNMPYNVAIKRIEKHGNEGFLVELDVLIRCEHPNIVSLLGYCNEDDEKLLIYELASNGSLEDYLENNSGNIINLTWAQLLKICIDIACGLNYLHTNMEDRTRILHRDIKSGNILLGENLEAKIADFGLSKFQHANQDKSTINASDIAGTQVYLDPEYAGTGRLKKASDIYSFGVVLFEIFSGTLAYDSMYTLKDARGLAAIARKQFKSGTIKEMLDPKIMDEAYELGFIRKTSPDDESLDVFLKVAYECVARTQDHRPTIEVIIKELKKALHFQVFSMRTLKIPLEHIKSGVENFSSDNCILRADYGMLYKGTVEFNDRHMKVVVKRFSKDWDFKGIKFSWERGFLKEFEVLFRNKHENIIGLVGYSNEEEEKIIVYKHPSKGNLNKYLNDASFSWTQRLKVCLDVAKGLKFLHGDDVGQDVVIHRDLKSSNILLTDDWKAKICGFEHALTYPLNKEIEYVINDVISSLGYCDPVFQETRFLTKESDIYSFGVILFETLCGRSACPDNFRDGTQFLDVLVKRQFQVARLDEIVFEGIKEQMVLQSFSTFRRIAFRCLHEEREERPSAGDVVVELQKALEIQEAYEIRDAELKSNYKEIIQVSKSPEIYSKMAKMYICDIVSKGILLEDDKREIIHVLQQTTLDLEHSEQPI